MVVKPHSLITLSVYNKDDDRQIQNTFDSRPYHSHRQATQYYSMESSAKVQQTKEADLSIIFSNLSSMDSLTILLDAKFFLIMGQVETNDRMFLIKSSSLIKVYMRILDPFAELLTQSLRSHCVALLLDVYLDSSSSTCCTFQ
jgi:hypothetical protein